MLRTCPKCLYKGGRTFEQTAALPARGRSYPRLVSPPLYIWGANYAKNTAGVLV